MEERARYDISKSNIRSTVPHQGLGRFPNHECFPRNIPIALSPIQAVAPRTEAKTTALKEACAHDGASTGAKEMAKPTWV